MKKCRLKIITAIINPDKNESDKEIIQYVSQNEDFMTKNKNINKKQKNEEEKSLNLNFVDEESTIIKERNELNKNKTKLSKEKVFLIDGLFSSTHNITKTNLFKNQIGIFDISQDKQIKEKENITKLHSTKKKNTNNENNVHKSSYTYKWEHKFDNVINTFYNSQNPQISNTASVENFSQKENSNNFDVQIEIKNNNNINKLKENKLEEEEQNKNEKDEDNLIKINEPKIENNKINSENIEINREDELKGEIFILKNKFNILLNQLKEQEIKISQYQDVIKHKNIQEKIIEDKKNEIINYYQNLNECLSKGEILLVTRPNLYNYINSKNNENNNINKNINDIKDIKNEDIKLENDSGIKKQLNKNIDDILNYDIVTLLLKGYFINMNLKNAEEIVNEIWNNKKPIQTFESLKEELLKLINKYISAPDCTFINEHNRNIVTNYLYSFCNSYQYMTKDEFTSLFNDKLGYFNEFNENELMNKLYKFCDGKLNEFIKILKNLDEKETGKIDINEFLKSLYDNNIIICNKFNDKLNHENLNEQKNIIDLLQLLVVNMKKNIIFMEKNSNNENKDNNTQRIKNINETKRKIDIYELYYESLIKIICENKNSESPLYKRIIKKYLIDKNINSMKDFMETLLLNNDVIINKDSNKYLKSDTFNNFLIANKVIGENETFLIPYNEESLIEINQLILEVDQANPLIF